MQRDDSLEEILQGTQVYISFITELELIGYHGRSKENEAKVDALLNDCIVVPLSYNIKIKYKSLRKSYKLKLADCLVAATSLSINLPLITADKQFKSIKQLQLMQYER